MTNIYARDVSHIKTLDPYRLQELYKMHPCAEHVVKKLLVAGEREGGKNLDTDISDCIRTLQRWREMREEDGQGAETIYDWDAIPSNFGWAAADEDGDCNAYVIKPVIMGLDLHWSYDETAPGQHVSVPPSHKACLDWRDSLERRP